MDVFWDAV